MPHSEPPKIVVIGSYVQDLMFSTPEFPRPGQTLIGKFKSGPGGKGSNQAVAAARTGVPIGFIGAVGKDAFAIEAQNCHEIENIDSRLAIYSEAQTGAAAIMVNKTGENEIVVALGTNNLLQPSDVPEEMIQNAKILVSQLECNLEAATHALKLAQANGVTTILNPAPMRDDFDSEMLDHTDILIPNETEFAHLLRLKLPDTYGDFNEDKIHALDEAELHSICRDFGVDTFIITLGSQGCFVSTKSEYYTVPPIAGINVVDTTGAGDAFVGGFSSGLIQFNGDLKQATEYGNVVAGLSVTKFGTAPSMPVLEEINSYIATLGRYCP